MVGIVVNKYAELGTLRKEILKALADLDNLVNRRFKSCFPRKILLFKFPFMVALTLRTFGIFDNRQVVLTAKNVRHFTEFAPCSFGNLPPDYIPSQKSCPCRNLHCLRLCDYAHGSNLHERQAHTDTRH